MILVVGDYILDRYLWHRPLRICPEAPVPVLVQTGVEDRAGGAALVSGQLAALGSAVALVPGSHSTKTRIFADHHMIARVDNDSHAKVNWRANLGGVDAGIVVISDYNKGTFNPESVAWLRRRYPAALFFVDAKVNFKWYADCFACFPNAHETPADTWHVIRKLGAGGCNVDGQDVPLEFVHSVLDVTGAGDVFLAAFVHSYERSPDLMAAAAFANYVAAKSVEHLGTHVVRKEELAGVENRNAKPLPRA